MAMDERLDRARRLYERAVFSGDIEGLAGADRDLDAIEADLAVARGRVLHARFLADRVEDAQEIALFERALELYRRLDDARGEGEALFWIGIVHQVVRDDSDTAVPVFEQARKLAAAAGDKLTLSYVLRHLGFAEHGAGRLEPARELLEESSRLRQEIGFTAGVAANFVGLIFIAVGQGRREEALTMLTEATAIAEAEDARVVLRDLEEARTVLSPEQPS
jgi:tetratricopeptide (TPR) repeat protein